MESSSNSNNGGERVEKRAQVMGNHWGRRPLKQASPKSNRYVHFRALPVVPATPAVLPPAPLQRSSRVVGNTGQLQPVLPGSIWAQNRGIPRGFHPSGGTDPVAGSVLPPIQKLWTTRYGNFNIFCIRTPNLMILGSFRRGQPALQDHAEKHHSPREEDITK